MSAPRRGPWVTPPRVTGVAIGVAVTALALVVVPARPRIPALAAAAAVAPPAPPVSPVREAEREAIVRTNVFSGSRRAPRERFRVPGTDAGADTGLSAGTATDAPPAPAFSLTAGREPTGPQLFGLVTLGGVPRALVQSAADSVPRLVRVGERVGAWRVQFIGTDRVVLSSSAGTRTVRLSRDSSPDTSGTRP